MPKALLVVLGVIILLIVGVIAFYPFNANHVKVIDSFEQCQAARYLILESWPEQCKTPDGKTFVRNVSINPSNFGELITLIKLQKLIFGDGLMVTLLELNDSRCKPGVVCIWQGEISAKFQIMGASITSAQEFSLRTERTKSMKLGEYIFALQSATENDATIMVNKTSNQGACYKGGCSGQICSDRKDIVSTCEYREEYACYQTATCARQANGQCGWTQTSELTKCLENK